MEKICMKKVLKSLEEKNTKFAAQVERQKQMWQGQIREARNWIKTIYGWFCSENLKRQEQPPLSSLENTGWKIWVSLALEAFIEWFLKKLKIVTLKKKPVLNSFDWKDWAHKKQKLNLQKHGGKKKK